MDGRGTSPDDEDKEFILLFVDAVALAVVGDCMGIDGRGAEALVGEGIVIVPFCTLLAAGEYSDLRREESSD